MASCTSDIDCQQQLINYYPYCVDGTCQSEGIWEYAWAIELIIFVVFGVIAAILSFWYPLLIDQKLNRCISALVALFAFPVYLALLIYQNPRKGVNGENEYILPIIFFFVFWPVVFCVIERPKASSAAYIGII